MKIFLSQRVNTKCVGTSMSGVNRSGFYDCVLHEKYIRNELWSIALDDELNLYQKE